MNHNAQAWIVNAWRKANEINTSDHWLELQGIMLILQCCAGTSKEMEEFGFLVHQSGERFLMCQEVKQ